MGAFKRVPKTKANALTSNANPGKPSSITPVSQPQSKPTKKSWFKFGNSKKAIKSKQTAKPTPVALTAAARALATQLPNHQNRVAALSGAMVNLFGYLNGTGAGWAWQRYEWGMVANPRKVKRIIEEAKTIHTLAELMAAKAEGQAQKPPYNSHTLSELLNSARHMLNAAEKAHKHGNHARAWYGVSTACFFLAVATYIVLMVTQQQFPLWLGISIGSVVASGLTHIAGQSAHMKQLHQLDYLRGRFLSSLVKPYHNYGHTAFDQKMGRTLFTYPHELGRSDTDQTNTPNKGNDNKLPESKSFKAADMATRF